MRQVYDTANFFYHLAYHDRRLIPLTTVIYAFISSTEYIHTGKFIHNLELGCHFLTGRAEAVFFENKSHNLTGPIILVTYEVDLARRSQALIQNLLIGTIWSKFNSKNTLLKAGCLRVFPPST